MEGSFSLQGSTRSADPSLIRALEGSDAEPEPTARCEPGLTSPPIGFEVLDDSGRPASGVAVLFNANSLDLIGSPIQVTDAFGRFEIDDLPTGRVVLLG